MAFYIAAHSSVTPAGKGPEPIISAMQNHRSFVDDRGKFPLGLLPDAVTKQLDNLKSRQEFRLGDRTSLLAVMAAQDLRMESAAEGLLGVSVGSSRGPTGSLEMNMQRFISGKRLEAHTSPVTTFSAPSVAVARTLKASGPTASVSSACSSAISAIVQGLGWLQLGLCQNVVAGAVEASATEFTAEILQAARVLSREQEEGFYCRPFGRHRSGTVLGEGAALFLLTKNYSRNHLAEIKGWGQSTEAASMTGVDPDGKGLEIAIRQSLGVAGLRPEQIGLIIGHGTGTEKGDAAEINAYLSVFKPMRPLCLHKSITGHMLGASAGVSLIVGLDHMRQGFVPAHPYATMYEVIEKTQNISQSSYVLVVAMGFGGISSALVLQLLE